MNLEKIIATLNELFSPISIVLYGSRARIDFLPESDYELGLFYPSDKPVLYSDLKQVINKKGVNIYPFDYERFLQGNFDTPFQKTIYKRELIKAGKTLSGVNIQELSTPPITIIDLIEDVRFNSGYALASLISLRNNDPRSSSLLFYKSCLFATRSPIMLHTGKFPYTYDDILRLSKKSIVEEFQDLIEKAYELRKKKGIITSEDIVRNITYINYIIEPMVKAVFEKDKEMVIVG